MTQGLSHVILSSEHTNWHCPDRPPPGTLLLPLGPQQDRALAYTHTHAENTAQQRAHRHTMSLTSRQLCAACGGDLNECASVQGACHPSA